MQHLLQNFISIY